MIVLPVADETIVVVASFPVRLAVVYSWFQDVQTFTAVAAADSVDELSSMHSMTALIVVGVLLVVKVWFQLTQVRAADVPVGIVLSPPRAVE